MKYEDQSVIRLTPRHLKILDYCVEGLCPKDIAIKLGMTARQVGIVVNSGSFQHQLAIRRKAFEEDIDQKLAVKEIQAADILKNASADAAKTLVGVMKLGSEGNRLRSAEAILDRSGNPRNIRAEDNNDKPIINISHDDLLLLKETLELENSLLEKCSQNDAVLETPCKTVTSVEK